MVFENICFSGGGSKTISFTGAIKALEEEKYLKGLCRFAGSSAGSLFATLLACKFNADEIIELIKETNINELAEGGIGQNLIRLAFNFGFYNGKAIEEWVENMFRRKGLGKYTTFIEIYEVFGSELIITGTNLNKQRTVYYSPCKTPKMHVIEAIRISTSIPLFIQPVNIEGDLYGDGSLLCNYPIHIFKSVDRRLDKTIGFCVKDDKDHRTRHKFENIVQFLDIIIGAIMKQSQYKYEKGKYARKTVLINTYDVGATHFDINKEIKKKLIRWGHNDTLKWLKKQK